MEKCKKSKFFIKILPLVVIFFIILSVLFLIYVLNKKNTIKDDAAKEMARIEIELDDGAILEEINNGDKHIEYSGTMKIYDGSFVVDGQKFIEYRVTIEGRGNSTWNNPKKPYQIKMNNKVSLLGMDKSKKWVLLANYFDKSYLRNDLALYFAEMVEEKYANGGEFIELSINGEPLGLYYLIEKVNVAKNSVNLRDDLGILVEQDNLWSECEAVSKNGGCFIVKDMVDESMREEALADFMEKYNELEIAIKEEDFEKIERLIDVESFVKYYLISEFTVNPDAYVTSFYFYKDGKKDKIHAGPVWDFDFALANADWGEWILADNFSPENEMERRAAAEGGEYVKGDDILYLDVNSHISKLFYNLMDINKFRTEVKKYYQKYILGKKNKILEHLKNQASYIEEKALEDEKIWKREEGEFKDEVKFLYDWVSRRLDFMDERYGAEKF